MAYIVKSSLSSRRWHATTRRMSDGLSANHIGGRLFQARTEANLSMRALAEKASLSPSAVNEIEKGHKAPTALTTEKLAIALGLSPCWLAYGIGPKEMEDCTK